MKTDKELMNEIKAALAAVPELTPGLQEIYVLVNDGTVILSGQVEHQRHKDQINEIVSAIPGVDKLINEIKVEQNIKHRVGVEIDWDNGRMELR